MWVVRREGAAMKDFAKAALVLAALWLLWCLGCAAFD